MEPAARGERLIPMGVDVIVVGASARAAAASARRAGFRPYGIDLFGDADLRAIAPVVRCPTDRYPHGLPDLLANAPAAPWFYAGGLENHPDLVAVMARLRPLWGNGPDALRRVRSPRALAAALAEAGVPGPEVRPADDPPPTDWQPYFRDLARSYRITPNATPDEPLVLHEPPVLRWSQPVRGGDDGALYVWLRDGRPA